MNNARVSVVIPLYNEAGTINEIVQLVEKQNFVTEIIIVDDGSTDGSKEIIKKFENKDKFKIVYNESNMGKGAALKTGFKFASENIILVQDADIEYDPADYHILLGPIISGKADVVFGSRFLGGPHRVLYFWHYIGNRLLTLLSNALNNINLTDMEVCYKVFKKEILKQINLKSNKFGFEPEITAKVSKLGVRLYEVPVRYYGRTYKEGKKINWKDGIAALWWIIRFHFKD